VGDWLIVSSCNGLIRALDKQTGQVRWSYDIHQDGDQTEFHGDPLITEKLIVITTDGNMGHVYAFDRLSGAVRWKYPVQWRGLASDVVRSGENIYALTLGDELLCLDLDTGQVRWTFQSSAPRKSFFWASSPTLGGSHVFFGGLDGFVYALDARTGKLAWKSDLGARVTTSVVSQGNDLYVGTANHHLYRIDAVSGKILADLPVEAEPRWRLILTRDSLLAFLGPQILASFDLSLKGARWAAKASHNWTSARPYVWHELVLAGDSNELIAFRVADGASLWNRQIPGTIRGIAVSDDVLYVGTLRGPLLAFGPIHAKLGCNPLGRLTRWSQ